MKVVQFQHFQKKTVFSLDLAFLCSDLGLLGVQVWIHPIAYFAPGRCVPLEKNTHLGGLMPLDLCDTHV